MTRGPAGAWRRTLTIGVVALRSAWRTRAAIRDGELADLIRQPTVAGATGDATDAARSTRLALFTLRQLAHLAGAGWRATCLYRAVAECLVLRAYGYPASLMLGVRGASDEPVTAHAWVQCAGLECMTAAHDADDRYVPLR